MYVHQDELLPLVPARLALGTDYPFVLGEDSPGKLIDQLDELSTQDKQRILSGTAIEFLDLDAAKIKA